MTAPTFQEFSMSMKSTSVPEHLHPDQQILDSEIQQITPEEFNRNIQTAESTIQRLIELKLPRSLKRKIGECATDIQNSKRSKSHVQTSNPILPNANSLCLLQPLNRPAKYQRMKEYRSTTHSSCDRPRQPLPWLPPL